MGSGEGDADSAGTATTTATATIEDVRIEVKTTRVYNLEVENLHTFFVGVQGLIVHNGVRHNQQNGDAYRDRTFERMKERGRNVEREVTIPTPFGDRRYDIVEYARDGGILRAFECKKGPNARYRPDQRSKDRWNRDFADDKFPTILVRTK